MASGKGKLLGLLGGLVLKSVTVEAVDVVAPRFRRLRLAGQNLRGLGCQPGDKVQLLLPSEDVRTYTPILTPDGAEWLLVYLQDDTPAARWGRSVKAGDPLRFVGPQRSLSLPAGPVALAGDETSIAVGAAYAAARPGQVQVALCVGDPDGVAPVLRAFGLSATLVRTPAELAQALVGAPMVGLTGGAKLIQDVRARLGGQGTVRVKAYWAEGKAGLD